MARRFHLHISPREAKHLVLRARERQGLRILELTPLRWGWAVLKVAGKALTRLWGRDVMLYVGGVSFFALLAVFPALALSIGIYSLLSTPEQAAAQADAFAEIMPAGAQGLFEAQLTRLAHTPSGAASTQSVLAIVVGLYAAHRGFKALLAGLSFIHGEENPRGFFGFNLMALIVAVAAFGLLAVVSAAFLTVRVVVAAAELNPMKGVNWVFSEWTWASFGLTLGLMLIYRYAMSRTPVGWRASALGGAVAALMFIAASWASAYYVEQIAHLGATYGSVAAVVVFLIWLSWNVNAIFFGGAVATEAAIALGDESDAVYEAGRAEVGERPTSAA